MGQGNKIGQVISSIRGEPGMGSPSPRASGFSTVTRFRRGRLAARSLDYGLRIKLPWRETLPPVFTRPVERIWLQLQKGTIDVENSGESNILVTTAKLHIEPSNSAAGRIRVTIRADDCADIDAVAGDVKSRMYYHKSRAFWRLEYTRWFPRRRRSSPGYHRCERPAPDSIRTKPTPALAPQAEVKGDYSMEVGATPIRGPRPMRPYSEP